MFNSNRWRPDPCSTFAREVAGAWEGEERGNGTPEAAFTSSLGRYARPRLEAWGEVILEALRGAAAINATRAGDQIDEPRPPNRCRFEVSRAWDGW